VLIKGPPCLAFRPRRRPPVRSGELAVTASVFLAVAAMDSLDHPSSIPVRRSHDTTRARSCSLSHWTPTFHAEGPPRRRYVGELPPQRRPSPSVRFQSQHLATPLHRGPWTCPVRMFLPTVQPSTIFARAAPRVLCAIAAPEWASRAPCMPCGQRRGPSTRCAMAMPGQAMHHRRWATQAACTVCVGRLRGFRPMDSFLNRNPFLFILT
jgi:hypothetical protein